jgi:hypothetical protein
MDHCCEALIGLVGSQRRTRRLAVRSGERGEGAFDHRFVLGARAGAPLFEKAWRHGPIVIARSRKCFAFA